MGARRLAARFMVAVVVLPLGVTMAISAPAIAEGIDPCAGVSGPEAPDWCLEQAEGGPSPPAGGSEGESAGGDSGEPMPCGWVTVPTTSVPAANSSRPAIFTNGRPPAGLPVTWQGWCYDISAPGDAFRGPFRWVPATAPLPVPTAADVALEAYEAIQGRIPDPAVVTNPPVGVDAVVDVPVFVSVTNWQVELVETRDLLGDTVTLTARPELVLNPAEPGAEVQTCVGGGRPYDPVGGDMWVQAAAPSACAHAYQQRTEVEGRPDQWSSTVTVRWSISWSATSGESGVFPVVERSVSIARAVGEVQAVVVAGGG